MKKLLRPLKKRLSRRVLPKLLYLLIRALYATMRVRIVGAEIPRAFHEKGEGVINVLWHGRLLLTQFAYEGKGLHVLASPHGDGEIIGKVSQYFGFHLVRGSSNKRGAGALMELVRLARKNCDLAITPDGPRGPAEVVKLGVAQVARITGRPVILSAFSSSRAKEFHSWDRFASPIHSPERFSCGESRSITGKVKIWRSFGNGSKMPCGIRQPGPTGFFAHDAACVRHGALAGASGHGAVSFVPVLYPETSRGAGRPLWICCRPDLAPVAGKRAIWIHAVSVGETIAVKTLLKALKEKFPDRKIVLSNGTETGRRVALTIPEIDRCIYFPFDCRFAVRRLLALIRPSLIMVVETEIWPNFLHTAREMGIPAVMVNGRIPTAPSAATSACAGFFRRFWATLPGFACRPTRMPAG